ncbi:MAG: hypothetical protein KatS3mg127_2008 [Silanimonas sp.]|nr:MAG: hypothetical protein KatS3mg127_2008 [Silanimonas sp.]
MTPTFGGPAMHGATAPGVVLDAAPLVVIVLVAAGALVAVSASGAWWLRGGQGARLLVFLGLAVGVLLGDVLLHLLPHAWSEQGAAPTLMLAIMGFGLFAAVDRLRLRAHHRAGDVHWSRTRIAAVLLVDGLHHLLDGVILAVAFSASPALGMATWIALLSHELPKERGELAILVAGGFLYLALFLLIPMVRRLRRQAAKPLPAPWRAMAAGVTVMALLAMAEQRFGLDHGHLHGVLEPEVAPRSFAPWLPEGGDARRNIGVVSISEYGARNCSTRAAEMLFRHEIAGEFKVSGG